MKTSFYFVLWIVIYPLLWLIPSAAVQEYSFVVALMAVFGLSALLNRTFSDTFTYARVVQSFPVFENVYLGNVAVFKKYLTREMVIEFITSLYFCIALAVIITMAFEDLSATLMELFIFGAFTLMVLNRSVKLFNAVRALKENPTQETCADILTYTLHTNYEAYTEARSQAPYQALFPPRPRYYSVYIVCSVIFAVLAILLGLGVLVLGLIILFNSNSIAGNSTAGIYLLYGALAIYYGIRDLITRER